MTKTSKILNAQPVMHDVADVFACKTCGTPLEFNFCKVCGEKKLTKHDFAFKHFVEETFEGFTHFDNKFFRTAKLLLTQPGELTFRFFDGQRVNYMRPFPMFIICNILFFVLVGKANFFSQPLNSFYNYNPYVWFGTQDIINKVAGSTHNIELLSAKFNEMMVYNSKAFLAILIPFLAIGPLIINNKRGVYLSEHLVFSTHFFTFIVVFYTFFMVLIAEPYTRWVSHGFDQTFDLFSTLICLVIISRYFGIAAKRYYGFSRTRALIGSIVIAFIFIAGLTAYRMLLFYKIIYAIH